MDQQQKDIAINEDLPSQLNTDIHVKFIKEFSENKDSFEYVMSEHLRASGIFWGLTVLDLLDSLSVISGDEVMNFLKECLCECGGIRPSSSRDPHILYTLSAVQVACLLGRENELPVEKIVEYIKSLQQPDGSFFGDSTGEVDTRFSFCAVACLWLLGELNAIDIDKALKFVMSCHNFDGGFGAKPDSESHAGQIYCCVGFLWIIGKVGLIDADLLGYWLCERQLPSGGFNGRPEKLPDVCYSWWVLASLHMIDRSNWIGNEALQRFILASQDLETGGFSDRPGDVSDPFHTLFGIAALSLMKYPGIKSIDPCLCMPSQVISRLNLKYKKPS